MATRYVAMQGVARIGAESTTPARFRYVFESQGVAILNNAVGNYHSCGPTGLDWAILLRSMC